MLSRGRRFLSHTGWLSRTDPEFAVRLVSKALLVQVAKDETIWRAGDEGGGLIGIVDGDCSLITSLGSAGAPLIHICRPGFWTGEATVLTGNPRRASLIARSDLYALSVPLFEVHNLMKERPEWWKHIGQLALELQIMATVGAADLLLPSNRMRCAAVLLRVTGHRFDEDASTAKISMSHDELGQMCGIGRQATARCLKSLEQMGLIKLGYGQIELLQPAILRQMLIDA